MLDELLKKIFGNDEKIDLKTFNDRLSKENGTKLVDLSKGEYVSKKKYDDEINALNKKYNDLDTEYKKVVENIANDDDEDNKKYNDFVKQFNDNLLIKVYIKINLFVWKYCCLVYNKRQ